jgi:alpha-1,2-mannosyltransferase
MRASAKDHPVLVATASVVIAVLLSYPIVDWVLRANELAPPFGYWDFGAYTSALFRVLHNEPMYVTNDQGGYFGTYLYPPFFVLFVWPFYELFEFGTAALLWQVTTVLFLWLSLQPVIRYLGHELRLWERGVLLWLLIGFHPLLFSVKQGQISAFLAGFLTLAVLGLLRAEDNAHRGAGYASGIVTAIVGTTKLVYGAVGAHLLADRTRFLGGLAGGLGIVLISLVVFGIDPHVGYYDVLRWGKQGPPSPPWLWMRTYFHPLYALTGVAIVVRLLLSGVLATLAIGAAGADVDREIFVMGVGAMPIIAPTAYTYYLTALVPAVAVLVAVELERGGYPSIPLVAVVLLHFHSYGLKFIVDVVFQTVPFAHADLPLLYGDFGSLIATVLQPGVWGAVLLAGLAMFRVATVASFRSPLELYRDRS